MATLPSLSARESEIVRRMQSLIDELSTDGESARSSDDFRHCLEVLGQLWPAEEDNSVSSQPSVDIGATPADAAGGSTGSESKAAASSACLPDRFGRFQIRRTLGHGGFGVVFLVFDPRLNREAALKIPRPEILVSPSLRQRFLREAQAAAVLDHPGIVPIYDTGELGPVGFILSAYCKGETLAAWLRNRLRPVAARLAAGIVARLADAVQHAHSRGILHRDLKPSNVLLEPIADSADAEFPYLPRLTDFGLAKRLNDATDETHYGTIVGTPRYMAPEQAAGRYRDVGVASDVYSLGVILYELLVGQPPFVGTNDIDTLRKISEHALSPSALRREQAPRDLESICLKCLQCSQAERYQSAGELADDLRRFLHGEPVLARRVTSVERLARWCGRHRAVAALAAAVFVSLVVGSAVSTYYGLAASARTKEAEAERERAVQAMNQARQAVDESFTLLSEQRLLNEPGMQPIRNELLQGALKYYESFVREQANDPQLKAELAAAYLRAGNIQVMLGAHTQALRHFERAVDVSASLVQQDPDSRIAQNQHAEGCMTLAKQRKLAAGGAGTEALLKQAIAIRERLVQAEPANALHKRNLAMTYYEFGNYYIERQLRTESVPRFRQALDIREELVQENPTDVRYRQDLAASYHSLGTHSGNSIEAQAAERKAIAIREQLVLEFPGVANYERDLAGCQSQLANLLIFGGPRDEADALLRRVIETRQKLVRENPAVATYKRDLADSYRKQASLYTRMSRFTDAEEPLLKAREILGQLSADNPSVGAYRLEWINAGWGLVEMLDRSGQFEAARQLYNEVIPAWEALALEEPEKFGHSSQLGSRRAWGAQRLKLDGKLPEAIDSSRRAIEHFATAARSVPDEFDIQLKMLKSWNGLARMLADSGCAAAEIEDYRQAIDKLSTAVTQSSGDDRPIALATLHARLALQSMMAGADWESVNPHIATAVELAPESAAIRVQCGDLAGQFGKWQIAAEHYERAADISDHFWDVMMQRARLSLATGDLEAYRRACEDLFARHSSMTDARTRFHIALTCVMGEGLADMAQLVGFVKSAFEAEPRPVGAVALGAVLYRAGQTHEATDVLSAMVNGAQPGTEPRDAWINRLRALTFLAMAYRDLGEDERLSQVVMSLRKQMDEGSEWTNRVRGEQPARDPDSEPVPRGSEINMFDVRPWMPSLQIELTRRELGDLLSPLD